MASFDPTGITEGLGVALGGAQFLTSLAEKKKNEAALAAIKDPFYKVQDEYYQNRNQAAGLAGTGLPTASKDYFTSEAGRGLSAGIGGVLQGGGSLTDISKLFDVYDRNIDRTAVQDAKDHIGNINNFWNYNKDLAGQKTTQWALNEYQPIQEKKKQLSQNIAAAKQNMSGGLNTALGSASSFAASTQNDKMLNGLNENNSLLGKLFSNQSPAVSSGFQMPVITGNTIGGLEGIPTPEQFQLMNP